MSHKADLEKQIANMDLPQEYKNNLTSFLSGLGPHHVRNPMYVELENLVNDGQEEDAGIMMAAIISQDRMDDDHQVDWDRDTFIEALEGDLP